MKIRRDAHSDIERVAAARAAIGPAAELFTHCAPTVHDHARIERLFFEGVPEPRNGAFHPDLGRPGLGIEFKRTDARRYALS